MEGLIIIGVFVAALWVLTAPRGDDERLRQPWVQAGLRLGLQCDGDEVSGSYAGVGVRVRGVIGGDRDHIRFVVDSHERIPFELQIGRAEASGGREAVADELEGMGIVATGDTRFDAAVSVRGTPEMVAGLMDFETRQRVRGAVVDLDCVVQAGTICADLRGVDHEPELIEAHVRALVELVRRLRWEDEAAAERLSDNAREDPKASVRLRNLRLLLEHRGDSPLARSAAERAVADRDERVRRLAAEHLA